MKNNIIKDLKKFSIDIHELSKDPSNARTHDDKNLEAIRSSLSKFGQRSPIVVQRDGMVVRAGNGRLEAAKQLGWDKIAALVVDDDNVTATAYAIADNRTGELATWDDDVLRDLMHNLDDDLRIGFDEKDLKQVFNDPELKEINENLTTEFRLEIKCHSEQHQKATFEKIEKMGLDVRLVTI